MGGLEQAGKDGRSSAEGLSGTWAVLHNDAKFLIRESELHCLRSIALGASDDLVSHLLLKKLRLARIVRDSISPLSLVSMNSRVDFSLGGQPVRSCRLVHPSALGPKDAVGIDSLEGAGLIGLEAGQTILWPDHEGGDLRPLNVIAVHPPVRVSDTVSRRSHRPVAAGIPRGGGVMNL